MLHQIGEVFVGREAEACGRAIDDRIHGIGGLAAHCGDRGDGGDLHEFLGRSDPENRPQDQCEPRRLVHGRHQREWYPGQPQQ